MKIPLLSYGKEPESLTFTFAFTSGIITLVMVILESFSVIKDSSSSMYFTLSCFGLYLGRRITYKGQEFGSEKAKDAIKKVEEKE